MRGSVTVSNFLLRSGNAVRENVKENKGDKVLWCENTHRAQLTVSRMFENENENHSHLQQGYNLRGFYNQYDYNHRLTQ